MRKSKKNGERLRVEKRGLDKILICGIFIPEGLKHKKGGLVAFQNALLAPPPLFLSPSRSLSLSLSLSLSPRPPIYVTAGGQSFKIKEELRN